MSDKNQEKAEAWLLKMERGHELLYAREQSERIVLASLTELLDEKDDHWKRASKMAMGEAEARVRELERSLECDAEPVCGQCLVCKSEKVRELEAEVEKLKKCRANRSLDDALNSGDGSYKP